MPLVLVISCVLGRGMCLAESFPTMVKSPSWTKSDSLSFRSFYLFHYDAVFVFKVAEGFTDYCREAGGNVEARRECDNGRYVLSQEVTPYSLSLRGLMSLVLICHVPIVSLSIF
ncbi:hypothetical protein BC629DRAFT_756209 [Irpex lacteus]|nr:hypothetical protein BC629DRAFT_756209 [Irpex lacteus]